jgi:uncharacterized protein (DUF433 family)
MSVSDTAATGLSSPPSPPDASPTSWVEKTPGVCGGDARIRATRITVRGLVERRAWGLSDAEILEHLPGLTQPDLNVAWEYYEAHREEIDQAIRENDEV